VTRTGSAVLRATLLVEHVSSVRVTRAEPFEIPGVGRVAAVVGDHRQVPRFVGSNVECGHMLASVSAKPRGDSRQSACALGIGSLPRHHQNPDQGYMSPKGKK
jgi:hypothetical protein